MVSASEHPGPAAAPARPRRGYWVPGFIAMTFLVVVSVAFVLVGLQSRIGRSLQGPVVAGVLALDLETGGTTPAVHCPREEPLRPGIAFDCSVRGPHRLAATVRVTETSSTGSFRYRLLATG